MSYVLLQCVKERNRLRVKMISSHPFIKGINCQFPRNIRQEGMYYVIKSTGIHLKGKFYSAMQKDCIVCQTFDINEVRKYIDGLCAEEKIQPKIIFGDDDDNECAICMSEIKNSVFSPCGHYVTCGECSGRCKNCPICRTVISCVLRRDEIKN